VGKTAILQAARKEKDNGNNYLGIKHGRSTRYTGQCSQAHPGSTAENGRQFSAEDKIRIVLEGFRKEAPVSDLCRRENISSALYYLWLKDFMEVGKACLKGDSLRDATQSEVRGLRGENGRLKGPVGEQVLQIQLLEKSLNL
jgi:transposase